MRKLNLTGSILPLALPLTLYFCQMISSYLLFIEGVGTLEAKPPVFVLGIGVWMAGYAFMSISGLACVGIILFFGWKRQFKMCCIPALVLAVSIYAAAIMESRYPPGYIHKMEGFQKSAQEIIPFEDIRNWLMGFESPEPDKEWLNKKYWPDSIMDLAPAGVSIGLAPDNTRFLRLAWSDPLGSWGVVIGTDSSALPSSPSILSEYRKDIEADIYIWYEAY